MPLTHGSGLIRNPERDISFLIFIGKETETRELERKSRLNISFKRYNKSLNRYKIEWKLKQENKNGH